MDSHTLLNESTLLELWLLEIDPDETLKQTTGNKLGNKTVRPPTDYSEPILNEYSKLFQGIRYFQDKKTGEK